MLTKEPRSYVCFAYRLGCDRLQLHEAMSARDTFRVTLKVLGDGVDPVAIGFVRVPLDATLQVRGSPQRWRPTAAHALASLRCPHPQAVRAQAEELLPGLPEYHFRIVGGLGDTWGRGSVPVAPQQEASEPAEDTMYLALGPAAKAAKAVAHDAQVFAANDAPNPFVRGFARGVYAADYAAATKHAAAASRRAAPLVSGLANLRALGLVN